MNASGAGYRIGVDVGGTFTDVVCVRDGRPPLVFKVPSTPADPGEAALAAVARLAAEGVEPGALTQLAHGTTVATNAVLERKGGRLGIITTEGFRDTLEIGRQMRREMYEVRLDPQTPVFLASRAMRIGVRERVGPGGEVIEPLDEGSVRAALDRLVAAGAECVAVCLLFSFVNPKHERRVREIARSEHPELEVSLSSEVDPRVPRVRTDCGHRLRRVHQADGAALPHPARAAARGCRGAGAAPGDAVERGARERRNRPEPPPCASFCPVRPPA